ncbi:MAG: flagellar hook-basal body complex protein FliE [Oscillospiraceae bacterium]|nr:flagellar hook-basal body complex protein FliE [Oscillospiraceae bacterium]
MPIAGINFNNNHMLLPQLMTAGRVQAAQPVVTAGAPPSPTFSSFLTEAIDRTIASDAESKMANVDLLLGEGDQDLHSVIIAGQKAEVLLNLTVQIRNKMVESYQEIMRMQI